jgi:hypothetical protein
VIIKISRFEMGRARIAGEGTGFDNKMIEAQAGFPLFHMREPAG